MSVSVAFTRKRITVTAIIVGSALAVLVADWIHVSPAEKIRAAIDRMVDAAAQADARGILNEVVPDYRDEGVDRKALEAMTQRFFQTYGPTRVSIRSCSITVEAGAGLAELSLNATVSKPHFLAGRPVGSNWRLAFIEQKGRWRVDRIMPLSLASDSVTSIANVARHLRIPLETSAPMPAFEEPEP